MICIFHNCLNKGTCTSASANILYCINDAHLSRAHKIIPALQVPVVHEMENAIHWINSYLVNKCDETNHAIRWIALSTFEQPGLEQVYLIYSAHQIT